jgi:tellurite resistance protein
VHRPRRIPPNVFTIAFGLAGLGQAWRIAGRVLVIPAAVPDAIFIVAAVTWLVVVAAYGAQGPRRLLADLRDPVLAPFVPVAVIAPTLLSAELSTVAFGAGRVLVVVFVTVTIVVAGLMLGQWIAGSLDQDRIHPGYFLPTVAGGLVGASAVSAVHLHALAEALFGLGVFSWLVLGSTLLYRLFFRPMLPAALVPTLAIEVAPPCLAGFAYFELTGGVIDFAARALGGYAVLMVLMQLRFIPLYVRLRFSVGFWAFTFSYAVAAADALLWIAFARPRGATGYAIAVITLISVLIAAIAARTIIALGRGQFLAAPPAAALPRQRDHRVATEDATTSTVTAGDGSAAADHGEGS